MLSFTLKPHKAETQVPVAFYSVHCGKPIEACDDNGRKTLSEYISRAPFSLGTTLKS